MQEGRNNPGTLFQNKTALVTGAGRGIGRAIGVALAKNGAFVVFTDMELSSAEDSAAIIAGMNLKTKAYKMDVSNKRDVNKVFDEVLRRLGRLDILVNNAGVYATMPFEDITEDQWDTIIDTNLKGPFLCSQAGFKIMKYQGGGSIIMISGDTARSGGMLSPGLYNYSAHYCASKAGIETLTKSIAFEGAPYGIRVNAVSPGPIKTDLVEKACSPETLKEMSSAVPLGRFGVPEEIAEAVIFLASDKAAYVTAKVLDVNGGTVMD